MMTQELKLAMFRTVDNLQQRDNPDYVRQLLYNKVLEFAPYATDEMCHYIEMLMDEYYPV